MIISILPVNFEYRSLCETIALIWILNDMVIASRLAEQGAMRHYFFNSNGVVYFTQIMRVHAGNPLICPATAGVPRDAPHRAATETGHQCIGWPRRWFPCVVG